MRRLLSAPLSHLLLPVAIVSALTWFGLDAFWGEERVPFEDIRWKRGEPEVRIGGEWSRLLSVNGVRTTRLIERAIAEWGPAYQDRFVQGFGFLAKEETRGLNILYKLTVGNEQGEKSKWAWSTRGRYRKCIDAVAKRQTSQLMAKLSNADNRWLQHSDALADLRHFAWTLEHRYAYLSKSKASYQGLLDGLLGEVAEGISRRDLALAIERVLVRFEDAHTRVSFGASGIRTAEQTLPCELLEIDGKIACLKPGGRGFVAPDHPFLVSINGVSLETVVRELAPGDSRENSTAAFPHRVLQYLKMTEFVTALAGRSFDGTASLTLESVDGKKRRTMTLECSAPVSPPDFTRPVEARILEGTIGHFALRKGMYPGDEFKREIIDAMTGLQHTQGMILDLRGNPGGQRDSIPLLLRYFLPAHDLPMVVSLAAVRMDMEERPDARAELLRNRLLWSTSWSGWTMRERQLIEDEIQKFRPAMPLPEDAFSKLHFMVVPREHDSSVYYYPNKVIVLQDGETGSAAGLLLSALKGRTNIQLMGSTASSDSGYSQAYRLPRSNIVYWLSSMASFRPGGSLTNDVEPDVPYTLTLGDLDRIAAGADPLLERAADWLRSDRPSSLERRVGYGYPGQTVQLKK